MVPIARFVPLIFFAACFGSDEDSLSLESTDQEVITERNALIATGLAHSCAVNASGSVQCWGRNQFGQLGNGTLVDSAAPVTVAGITTATMVTAGDYHSCAVLANGTARCWGANTAGQLGNNTTTNRTTPVTVSSLSGVTSISAGGSHTCASLESGGARCWGSNAYGQLGTNTTTNSSIPLTVRASSGSLAGVAEIDAGKLSTCARLTGGTVQCWGRNQYGQLGTGTYTSSSIAVPVSGITTASDLSVGDSHACVALSNARARCWGFNLMGQLGDGTQTGSATPVEMKREISPGFAYPLLNVTAIAAGNGHTCMRSYSELWCTGRNDWGEHARDVSGYIELYAKRASPQLLVEQVATGNAHTCVRRPGGAVACFGKDTNGQVGELGLCPARPTARVVAVRTPALAPTGDILARPDASGALYYTNSNRIEIDLETTACATVSQVDFKWGAIEEDDPIEPSDGLDYMVVSTVDRADGVRATTVRVTFANAGNGTTYPVGVTFASPAGNTATAQFTLAEVLTVNQGSGAITMTRDEIFNEVLWAMYKKWGFDANRLVRSGVDLYNFDFAYFDMGMASDGIWFQARTKADLVEDWEDGDLCNPTAWVYGKFRVVYDPDTDQLKTAWVTYPTVYPEFPNGCVAVTLGLTDIAAIFVDWALDDNIARKVEAKIAGLRDCSIFQCNEVIETVTHLDDGIEVKLKRVAQFPTVSYRVPYQSTQLDEQSVGDPMRRGIAIPTNEALIVVASGVAQACGTQSAPCNLHAFGPAGLFNWNWPAMAYPIDPPPLAHVPIPDPWPDCPGGACYFGVRQPAWDRQTGMRRDLTTIGMSQQNPGAVIGRVLRADGTASGLKGLGAFCGLGRPNGTAARLVVGRNDIFTNGHELGTGDATVTLTFTDAADFLNQCPE